MTREAETRSHEVEREGTPSHLHFFVLTFVAFVASCLGLFVAPVGAEETAMEPVAAVLKSYVDRGEVAGAVSLVWRDGRIVQQSVTGYGDLAAKRALKEDDVFWVASMTKPMTAACVMMLADEGKLSIDDPLEKYLPEFTGMWVVAEKSADRMVLAHPKQHITLRHLLTHTSGLPDVPMPHEGTPLSQLVATTALQPLLFEPGTQWAYSNASINALGRVVEVVSKQSFEDFLHERFTEPLGMKDTTFYPTDAQASRLSKSYRLDPKTHKLEETVSAFFNGPVMSHKRTVIPGGGLFSTAPDMLRFYRMLLNGGELDGRRYLKAETVKEMTRTQTGDIKTGFTPGQTWGLGAQVTREPQGVTAMLSPGTFGHGGAYGTASWCDPKTKTIFLLMIQRSNLTPHGDGCDLRRDWQQAAVDALHTSGSQSAN